MNCNNKKYYGTFLLVILMFIIFGILKKNILYPKYISQRENFIGISDIKRMLSNEISKEDERDEYKENKERFNNENEEENKMLERAYINKEIKKAISNIILPEGIQGPEGPPGPSGGIYNNKGYLTSKLNINEDLKPLKMASALKPIGNIGSPILIDKADYSSDKKWMMNNDGTINNQYLGKNYCISLNEDISTDNGKYSLLELVDSNNGRCTQFVEDNNSRLKIKNSNNCMTIKNTSNMKGLNISVPNKKRCTLEEITNSECKLEEDSELLGVEVCNDIIKPEQTFVWF